MTDEEFISECNKLASDTQKPTAPAVLALAKHYRSIPGNRMGGSLHIVLDDYNVETGHVAWCLDLATKRGDSLGAALAGLLLKCSMTQRLKVAIGS